MLRACPVSRARRPLPGPPGHVATRTANQQFTPRPRPQPMHTRRLYLPGEAGVTSAAFAPSFCSLRTSRSVSRISARRSAVAGAVALAPAGALPLVPGPLFAAVSPHGFFAGGGESVLLGHRGKKTKTESRPKRENHTVHAACPNCTEVRMRTGPLIVPPRDHTPTGYTPSMLTSSNCIKRHTFNFLSAILIVRTRSKLEESVIVVDCVYK